MMGGKMPETCSAVNKRQDNKLENCCIWLVIYLNYNNKINLHKKSTNSLELQSLAHVTNTNFSSVVIAAVKSQVHSADTYS
jgi:hypothetical protein